MNTVEYISKAANALIKKHGTRDPFELCDALGINVRYMQLKNVKGFYFYQSRIKTVVLNAELDDATTKILCAHELGHACLHSDMLLNMRALHEYEPHNLKNTAEYEANIFAAELLISDEGIKELLESDEKSLFSLAKEMSVPAELIDFKLRIMNAKGYDINVPYLAQSNFLKGNASNI